MEKSSSEWKNPKLKNSPNPVVKIKSLIKNLDHELMELCNQCALKNRYSSTTTSNIQYLLNPIGHKTNSSGIRWNSPVDTSSRSINNAYTAYNAYNNPNCISPNSLLATVKDGPGGVNVRTLSSIYRAKVIDAYRNRRIFTIYGNYHTVRRALLRRGWLEKLAPGRYPKLSGLTEEVLLQHAKKGNDYEAMAISKIINHFPSFFIWQPKGFRDTSANVLPYRNRIRRSQQLDFSTKIGLIGCAEQDHWFRFNNLYGMSCPRFYRLRNLEERTEFIEDYRRTQCRNLIRFVIEKSVEPENIIDADNGEVMPSNVLRYAMSHIKRQLNDWEHNTLDEVLDSATEFDQNEWKEFLSSSNNIIQEKGKLKSTLKELNDFVRIAKGYMDKIDEKHPDYKWDGVRNLWILKPGYQCRGIGIVVKNTLDEILQFVSHKNISYLAQKYIERPLLIHKCKFDIRQYMLLVIGEDSAKIWLYKDCYFRFSSQEYTIDDLRESVHLTNNSVQKRYKVKPTRDSRLPKNNMWSLEQFKVYLKHQNASEDTWSKKIFGGFAEILTAVVLASFDETDFIENAFELYGCDFMLDEQYNPILIEINSTPDLSASTDVTARLCPMALKDVVKVIVDLPRNSRASTGLFEMVYEVNYKNKQDFDPQVGLDINGKAMTIHQQKNSVRNRLYKKLMPKRAETSAKIQTNKIKKNTTKMNAKAKSCESVPSKNLDGSIKGTQNPLKSFTKEALALRYTRPK